MSKQIKVKDEAKAPKKNNNKLKVLFKLVAGTAIVACTYAGVFPLLLGIVQEYPKYIAGGMTAIMVIALVTVLAWCDNK